MTKRVAQPNDCPYCKVKPSIYAGDGMWDHVAKCDTCKFSVRGTNRNNTIDRWNSAVGSIRRRMIMFERVITKYQELIASGMSHEESMHQVVMNEIKVGSIWIEKV